MSGRTVIGTPDEETIDIVLAKKHPEMVGVVFNDSFSYRLKFPWGYGIPIIKEHLEYSGNYVRIDSNLFCYFVKSPVGHD